jgi:hypothetical protein
LAVILRLKMVSKLSVICSWGARNYSRTGARESVE